MYKRFLHVKNIVSMYSTCTNAAVLVHMSRRLKCTIAITCCPSSVRCLKLFTFSTSSLKTPSGSQRNLKKTKSRKCRGIYLTIIYQFCVFEAYRKSKITALASDLLRHFRLLWNHQNGLKLNLTDIKNSTSSTNKMFFWSIGKPRWPPWPLIRFDIFDFFSTTPELNLPKQEARSQHPPQRVCFFGPTGKPRLTTLASDRLGHFRL